MNKLYRNSPILFAVLWIVAYCVLMSVGDMLSDTLGVQKSVTLPVALLLSGVLFAFLAKNRLCAANGLCRPSVGSARGALFYIPLAVLPLFNLLCGIAPTLPFAEILLYVLTMLAVGFLEEVIFRGLLFNAMRRETPRAAVIVSSITFGFGHIVNLINGSGVDLLSNLLQVLYATCAGFMFVMLYLRTESLIACILAHGIFNATSAFSAPPPSTEVHILTCLLLALFTSAYALFLLWDRRRTQKENP